MRLFKVRLNGYGRFPNAEFRANRKLTALVGPNEAGKTTVLRALTRLNDNAPIVAKELSRRASVQPGDAVISADFALTTEDLAVLDGLPLHELPAWLSLDKQADGTLNRRFDITVRYSDEVWDRATTETGVALSGLKVADEQVVDEALTDRVAAVEVTLSALADSILKKKVSLSRPDFDALLIELQALSEEVPLKLNPDPFNVALSPLVDEPIGNSAALKRLIGRIPQFELFSDQDRNLGHEYPIDELEAGTIPIALANVMALAGSVVEDILPSSSERTSVATNQDEANDVLAHVFDHAWRQHKIAVKISFDRENLILLVKDLGPGGQTVAFDERSDGLKLFVALTAFLATRTLKVPPILLIDEAEARLHWDAQADLVNVLSTANEVGQIIYTTHSPGCLPPDLGTGLLFVQPDKDNLNQSTIRHDFWDLKVEGAYGLSPILYLMGAGAAAFSSLRQAVMAEGPSDMILLPTLLRAATKLEELDYQIAPGISVTAKDELALLDQAAVNVAYLVDGDEGGRVWKDQLIDVPVDAGRIVELADGWGLEDLLDRETYVDIYLSAAGRKERFGDLSFATGPIKKQLEDICKSWKIEAPGSVMVADAILEHIEMSRPAAPDHQRVKLAPGAAAELKRLHAQFGRILKKVAT